MIPKNPLEGITRQDLSTDDEVRAMQDSNESLKLIIHRDGRIFCYLANSNGKALNSIVRTVMRVHENAELVNVDPVDLDAWLDKNAKGSNNKTTNVELNRHTPNVKLDFVFDQAVAVNASDVYLIINDRKAKLQFKVYGLKYDVQVYEKEQGYQLASLIFTKGHGEFDRTVPCDCSFTFGAKTGNDYRIRTNSIKTANGGNAIACRIRNPKEIQTIEQLGYSPQQLEHLYKIFHAPGGLILFVGATNSGKSTSVSSVMQGIPLSSHVIEIADPVEIVIDECVQIEIDHFKDDHEEVFKKVLASTVRQNPDVLVLGEIRDERTALAAVNMAIQGKRVFSTLHATSVSGVFPRLNGLGVPNHVLALPDFIAGIISQTLVAKACPECFLTYEKANVTAYEKSQLEGLPTKDMRFSNHETDCKKCSRGISGQELLAEVHPFYIDSGKIYEIIKKQDYFKILPYMKKHHGVILKSEHAREKIVSGLVCPRSVIHLLGNIRAS